jgi:hypothetical protein
LFNNWAVLNVMPIVTLRARASYEFIVTLTTQLAAKVNFAETNTLVNTVA